MPLKAIVVAVIIAAIVLVAGLIVLGLAGDFLVDWAWFSAVGYLSVFWTILSAKAVTFFAVFVGSGAFLWLNGALASRFSRSSMRIPHPSTGNRSGGARWPSC